MTKIKAAIEKQGDKEQAEPEELIEPMLTRFIAKVRFNKDKKLQVLVDHPSINQPIGAQQAKSVKEELQEGDWVVANLKTHPLRDDRFFYATINQFICRADDELALGGSHWHVMSNLAILCKVQKVMKC